MREDIKRNQNYDEKRDTFIDTSFKDGAGALNKFKHNLYQHTPDGQTYEREQLHENNYMGRGVVNSYLYAK